MTVEGENGERESYDPRRLHGVTLYRETERAFSEGDRVQFTATNREQHIANRESRHYREDRATIQRALSDWVPQMPVLRLGRSLMPSQFSA